MKIFILFGFLAIIFWPAVCWLSFHFYGWKKWQEKFGRATLNDAETAPSVMLVKFGSYNRCVRVGAEEYGISFIPRFFLFFHKSFSIPWVQILSFEYFSKKTSKVCILHTAQGNVKITGEIAEIIARGCDNHYVIH